MATTITQLLNTSGSFAFIGTWTPTTDAVNCASGRYMTSQTTGDTCTISWTGHSLYINVRLNPAAGASGGYFTSNTDGQPQIELETAGNVVNGSPQYYSLKACSRRLDLTGLGDGPHTTILTVAGANTSQIDTAVAISGQPAGLNKNSFVVCGDSISTGSTGLYQQGNVWPRMALRKLGMSNPTRTRTQLTNLAVTGTLISNLNGFNYQLLNQFMNNGQQLFPKWLNFMYGVNDLSQYNSNHGTPAEFLTNLDNALAFIEDVFQPATTGMVVTMGTAPYIHPLANYQKSMAAGGYVQPVAGSQSYEMAVRGQLRISRRYPWLHVADIYNEMKRRSALFIPSAANDFVHPNDTGHGIIAEIMVAAMLNYDFAFQDDASFTGVKRGTAV
jgi:lysophospholipase L1-like esterase